MSTAPATDTEGTYARLNPSTPLVSQEGRASVKFCKLIFTPMNSLVMIMEGAIGYNAYNTLKSGFENGDTLNKIIACALPIFTTLLKDKFSFDQYRSILPRLPRITCALRCKVIAGNAVTTIVCVGIGFLVAYWIVTA